MEPSLFERIGGEGPLRAIIADFIHRACGDAMIGFFFRSVDRERLAEMEYQFTASFLGAPISYEGRSMREAHSAHRIMGGQFDRRKQILKETLEGHQIADDIVSLWLAHVDGLRHLVTQDPSGVCSDPSA